MKNYAPDSLPGPDPLRRKLMLGLPGSLALASPLVLIACGGSDSGNSGGSVAADPDQAKAEALATKLPAVNRSVQVAKVALPVGSAVVLTSTRLVSANNVSQVGDNGTAGLVVIEGAPQMGYVFDASGHLLLMSMVETGVRTTVDSRGTAEALLLLTSEAYNRGPAIQIALRRALADARFDAVVEPLRLAVEAAAIRNGIDPADTALMDALKTATLALRRKSSVPLAASRARALAVTVSPAGAESGLTVLPTADFNNVVLQNQFRRRTHAFISRTGYYDAAGTLTTVSPAVPLKDFDLDATAALSFDSLVTSVGDYVTQFYADLGFLGYYESSAAVWQPVKSDSVQLLFAPDTAEVTVYTARVIGIGASAVGSLSDAENTALEDILWKTMIEDIIKPFVRTLILPMISERISGTFKPEFEQASWALVLNGITDLSSLAVAGTYFPNTVAALRVGDAKSAFGGFLTEFFSSNTFQGLLELGLKAYTQAAGKNLTAQLLDSNGKVIGVNIVAGDLGQFDLGKLKDALGKLARIIQLIKLGTLVGDYGAIIKDWASSQQLTQLTMNVSKAKVSLSPDPLVVVANSGIDGKGSVTAKVEGLDASVPAESVFLHWKCTGKYGNLIRLGGNGVNDFESVLGEPTHDYIPTGVDANPADPDTITVTAFYRNHIEMGSAKVTIEFKSEFNLGISTGPLQDVPADTDFPITAFIKENLAPGATVAWTWSPSGVGSLTVDPAGNDPRDSSGVFHAGSSEGSATVTVSAVVTIPATATTPLRVVSVKPVTGHLNVKKGLRQVVMEASGGSFSCTDPKACGVLEYGAFIVPRLANATLYSAVLTGFGYPACNRSLVWTSPKGDGGDCDFPISYHPHNSVGPTNFWAIWTSFGGAPDGKCVVTITLAP